MGKCDAARCCYDTCLHTRINRERERRLLVFPRGIETSIDYTRVEVVKCEKKRRDGTSSFCMVGFIVATQNGKRIIIIKEEKEKRK